MSLGQKIADLRKKEKISQNELGKRVGTSGDIIGRYERDEVRIVEIQSLPDEDKVHILYTIDGLLQNVRTKLAFAK